MRLFLFLLLVLFPLISSSCCTPECCCPGCISCSNPATDRCNSYSCTSYQGGNCGNYQRILRVSNSGQTSYINPGQTSYINPAYIANGNQAVVVPPLNNACNCKGGQPVPTECICPVTSNHQGTVVAISGTGPRIIHKDSCYGYDYCLLGLPGWVTIICSILLLLIFIILLFYCISCLVHYLII